MIDRKPTIFGTWMTSLLSILGFGHRAEDPSSDRVEPEVIQEIEINGFDPDGEPVIKKWSDGTLWIHFEAMPPFFAEDEGTEHDFDGFETTIQNALGVAVYRDDREIFIISKPTIDTAEKAKAWLEAYHRK